LEWCAGLLPPVIRWGWSAWTQLRITIDRSISATESLAAL